jgi:UDP-glucose 4-epimerase
MKQGTILVTGGAGYIGSHVALQLRARGERVVILDNLITGFRQAVLDCPLVVGNTGDREVVLPLLREHGVDTVMHFAAHTVVPDSVADPLKYYGNNTCATLNLLKCCSEVGVKQFVFSSTAAVYGIPKEPYAEETTATAPINPYGTSKLMSEWMLRDLSAAGSCAMWRYAISTSQAPTRRHASASRPRRLPCSSKWPARPSSANAGKSQFSAPIIRRPDGTGVRDYIHVEDLAAAHLNALDYLRANGKSSGTQLRLRPRLQRREVLKAVEDAAGKRPLPITEQPRRAGDPPMLVARAEDPLHSRLAAAIR